MDLQDLFKREGTADSDFKRIRQNTNPLLSRINGTPFAPDCESVTARQGNNKTLLVGLKIVQK